MKNAGEQEFIPPDLSKIKLIGKTNPRPDPLPVWRGEGIKALGGSRPLSELFAAAGCPLRFDAATIRPLIQLAREELKKL